jgi:sodium-dependent dicarboxylate transporter 2/3/5
MTLKWKDGVAGIDWGTLLLFGGGLAIGGMVFSTGLSKWIGESLTSLLGGQPSEYLFLTLFAVTALFLSELTSNTAVANLMGPIAIATAVSLGFSPVPVCVVMALCTSLAFMLPVSTPPNAITYSSGYIPITKMIKTGVYIDFIGIACVTIPLAIYFVNWITGM